AVVADIRPEDQAGTSLEELNGLHGGAFGDGRREIPVFTTDQHFALLLVEGQYLGVGQHGGVRDRLQGRHEDRHVAADEADLQAAGDVLGEVGAGSAADHAAVDRDVVGKVRTDDLAVLAGQRGEVHATEDREIDAQGVVVGQCGAEDGGLDEH